MPHGLVKTPADEKKWAKAKRAAHHADPDDFWAFVTSQFMQYKGNRKGKKK